MPYFLNSNRHSVQIFAQKMLKIHYCIGWEQEQLNKVIKTKWQCQTYQNNVLLQVSILNASIWARNLPSFPMAAVPMHAVPASTKTSTLYKYKYTQHRHLSFCGHPIATRRINVMTNICQIDEGDAGRRIRYVGRQCASDNKYYCTVEILFDNRIDWKANVNTIHFWLLTTTTTIILHSIHVCVGMRTRLLAEFTKWEFW